jgi:hypothetical protein
MSGTVESAIGWAPDVRDVDQRAAITTQSASTLVWWRIGRLASYRFGMWTTRNQSEGVVVGVDHPADRASRRPPSEGPQARPDPVAGQSALSRSWALFAGLVGPVAAAFCIAVEPPPADPNAPEPLIGTLLAVALLVAMTGAVWLGARRQVQALSWASAVGAVLVLMTITCPLSGHHTGIGMWWAAQFIVSGTAWAVAAGGRFVVTRGARTTAS